MELKNCLRCEEKTMHLLQSLAFDGKKLILQLTTHSDIVYTYIYCKTLVKVSKSHLKLFEKFLHSKK